MKKTWYQQQEEKKKLAKQQGSEHTQEHAHKEHGWGKPTEAAPAAGTPAWLTDLIAVLEAILSVVPDFEGHTTEKLSRADAQARLARLKEGLPK